MKRLLTIFFLLPLITLAQTDPWWGPGEYLTLGIRKSDSALFGCSATLSIIGVNNTGTKGLMLRVVTSPSNIKFIKTRGGLHGGAAIASDHTVWTVGDNGQCQAGNGDKIGRFTAFHILTDSSGNAFNNVVDIMPFFTGNVWNGWYAIKGDGTLWKWGADTIGMALNGTLGSSCKKPSQVILPGGRSAQQIVGGDIAILLCTDGTVWTAGEGNGANLGYVGSGNQYRDLHQVTFPGGASIRLITGGRNAHFAVGTNEHLYGWGKWGNYLGGTNSGAFPTGNGGQVTTPVDLGDSALSFMDSTILRMQAHHNGTNFISKKGTLYYMGDRSQGDAGDGSHQVMTDTSGGKTPYAWNASSGNLLAKHPIKIGNKSDWREIYGWALFNMFTVATDSKDSVYTWGRNKTAVQMNGIVSCDASGQIEAMYANSWDVSYVTPVHPFAFLGTWTTTCPGCINGLATTNCNKCSPPANTKPTANGGSTQNISTTTTTLSGLASSDNGHISYYEWKQNSGPNTAKMDGAGFPVVSLSGLSNGTYVFKLKVTDNEWLADSTTVTVNVGITPSASAGVDQSITLPTSSVTLDGTASTNAITYLWTQLSGPNTATLGTATASTCAASGLVAGTYIFQLAINGGASTDQVKITVNPQPTAQAGDAQTISFPQSSVPLDGSTSIGATSYAWTQISGPNTGNIATPTTAGTIVSGLIPGTYVFQLSINGGASTDQVTITVLVGCQVPNCLLRGLFKPKN